MYKYFSNSSYGERNSGLVGLHIHRKLDKKYDHFIKSVNRAPKSFDGTASLGGTHENHERNII